MDTSSKENIQLFCKSSMQPVGQSSFKTEYSSSKEKQRCCGKLKVFLGALSFVYFAKALAEGYLKSTITQIERRFDIPSSLVGVIDGSFEIGNLLVITFVSYFGAKLHRPKIIGTGCLIMGVGTLLIAMPQFFMQQYRYEKYSPFSNSTLSLSPCLLESDSQLPLSIIEKSQSKRTDECEMDAGSSMWVYVFLGNLLRGIGETPIQPLGIAYLDDFASEDNSAFYIGCVQTVAIIGPIFGFLLGSLCAKLYVDIGFVNLDHVTITPKDPQWVGAWWLGYLIAGIVSLLAALPFWCLPKSLPRPRSREDSNSSSEKFKFIMDDHTDYQTPLGEKSKIMEMARDFLPSLKNLFGNPLYLLYLCASTVQFNSLFGMVTYKPKYIEQQYGQSSSKANFVIGLINIPAVAFGIFSGGIVMKKFRISVYGAAKLYLGSSVLGYLLFLSLFALGCENSDVAGLTVSYQGTKPVSYHERALFSDCNSRCKCSETKWDPVCGENGITYASACLAGCQTSTRSGKTLIFYNCTCVGIAASKSGNSSGMVGRCQKDNGCPKMFLYFLVISVITSYTLSLGGIPGYILLLRCIKPQFKSFALGIYTLAIRVLAGIPAPVYFGILIDTSCLKWGFKRCGRRGSCRLYDSNAFRHIYLGLTVMLGTVSIFLSIAVLFTLKKNCVSKHRSFRTKTEGTMVSTRIRKENCTTSDHLLQPNYWPGKETQL
ncbi:solute carrier organic anion transporter family member 1C1 isoform X1 [Callorhinus ursinus]|uniref:Solute carrier organic anion transporter family member n=2 Tax=Otariidae TaxID=9702 RepID=A0A3Q7R5M5_CALUR|nr:solute carrier organic anion transporter family member 1C1 isoform X1 [Callorhinus ursinus]XP_027448527.1 solute carrier organic anion transporter family member 1C1 isoform X1 [Zalophus californianus]XP_027448528.1 solute carrier organic anion transporter family member 1C1 isoform X1 [Zalophus californianus]XP_027448529.1 solute carrier organic anion transporter family member 1C1 isoform X1 [Zalophus californianus]XP_027448530.1 solute carrier organic anion transporter family member 1C1 isof